jgi:RNA recognition motif-containing protein
MRQKYSALIQLLDIFNQIAQVKDIRMIRDRISGEVKDFAFIEFFTLDEANCVLAEMKRNPLSIKGQPVNITYSKIKRFEEENRFNEIQVIRMIIFDFK